MNTDFNVFGPAMMEKYFQRALFYGMWPGCFSQNAADHPYWQNPKWYERDRKRFQQYLPLIRLVAEAGWQPVTDAACNNDAILVERYGPDGQGAVYFTLLNDTAQAQSGELRCEAKALRLPPGGGARELIGGERMPPVNGGWAVRLAPQEVKVLCLATSTKPTSE
jgi:hypothetical protein